VIEEVVRSLSAEEREQLREALSYPEGTVGALMDFEHVTVRDDVTLEAVTRYLRRLDELPGHTDQLFVVDRHQALKGTLPLARLIVTDLEVDVVRVTVRDGLRLKPEDAASEAASAFERYDLVSAPVVDASGRLIGRLTVDAVVDYIRQKSAESQLAGAGLQQEEDVFAPVLDAFKNRWAWLAVNLVTAFIASRVIGVFEDSIVHLVALAALMPIVAGIGGNSGNQTITMIVRAMALGQIQDGYWRKLLAKELGVALLNGVIWGCLLGAIAYAFYGNVALGGVMAMAMMLNLLLAASMGVAIPWLRSRFGRDPAVGSSVLITACTDSGGFFIFLGLATIFLV
jgi:magnesium transporter